MPSSPCRQCLLFIIAFAGFFFGRDAVQGQVSNQITSVLGADSTDQVEDIITKASETKASIRATISV